MIKELPIDDCRLPIADRLAERHERCGASNLSDSKFTGETSAPLSLRRPNKNSTIANRQSPIANFPLFSRSCFARARHNGRQLVGFLQQRDQLACGHCAGLDEQLEPQRGFVGFFFDRADFSDEFGLATRSATSAIIRGDRSAATDNLLGNNAASVVVFWNGASQLDDPQSKSFRARFQLGGVHDSKLQIQPAVRQDGLGELPIGDWRLMIADQSTESRERCGASNLPDSKLTDETSVPLRLRRPNKNSAIANRQSAIGNFLR